MTPFDKTTVDATDAAGDFVGDWISWTGGLVLAMQGILGAATVVKAVARFSNLDAPAGAGSFHPALAIFTPDSEKHVEFVFTREGGPPLDFQFRWEVTGNDASTDLELLHGRG